MSVTNLINNFRSALLAILPAVEATGIAWRREDAYDEWDDLVSALYKALVVDVLCWTVSENEEDNANFSLPAYDLVLPHYRELSWLEVLPRPASGIRVFHSFQTASAPFDLVESRLISPSGEVLSVHLATMPVDQAEFRLIGLDQDGSRREIDEAL